MNAVETIQDLCWDPAKNETGTSMGMQFRTYPEMQLQPTQECRLEPTEECSQNFAEMQTEHTQEKSLNLLRNAAGPYLEM